MINYHTLKLLPNGFGFIHLAILYAIITISREHIIA